MMSTNESELPFSYDNSILSCPVCGGDNVHLQAVEVNAGGVVTKIDNQYPIVTEGAVRGRGTAINIYYWAECGHSWKREIFFYKGQTSELLLETKIDKQTDMWRE